MGCRGVASIFQGGGGGSPSVKARVLTRLSSRPPRRVVDYLLKYGLQQGGHGHPGPPSYALGLWVELVVGFHLAEGFPLGTLIFLPPQKAKLLFD